ncbi:MAG: hypothetical protein AAF845_01165 [Bacteroidota bacterium]
MHELKKMVALARDFLTSVIEDATVIRVEEIELADDGEGRLVTLSYLSAADGPLGQFAQRRIYKRFHVTPQQGVLSMTIRELEGA